MFNKLKKMFGLEEEQQQGSAPVTKETAKEVVIKAPLTGEIHPLSEVPDPVFAEKMMGDGFAITPSEGVVVAPFDGEIVQVFHTKHAIGIRSNEGVEILIHVGLETVKLNGEGFDAHITEGQKVNAGDHLLTFNIDYIKENAKSTITPVIFTNGDALENIKVTATGSIQRGSDAAVATLK
ncbi:PTS glucose transporter subunit IIA [Gottfriedia sp. NPDC057991]|uniref:PTS sugar transporter subunit IIA n=1 Tax=Gottfriedia sp. NPDC057991 TaxID=3346298 RepID=UPI0036DA6612